jgi:hypothetical protein
LISLCACSEEVSRARLNSLRGLGDHERVDEQLYHDYESEDARKVSLQAADRVLR